MDKVGIYKGKARKRADGTWAQYGERENGNLELILEMSIADVGVRSIALYINDKTLEFTVERLRALGWKGEDISNLDGIGDNEVDVEVSVEEYQGKQRNKYNIMTGAGRFSVQKPVDPKMFNAKFAALRGAMGSGGQPGGGAPPPPFD